MSIPWERRDGETPKAYAAFCIYRDLPLKERSIAATMERTGVRPGAGRRYEHWSSDNEWVARATAWDAHHQALFDAAAETETVEMGKRHKAYAQNLLAVASLPLKELALRLQRDEIDLEAMSVKDLMDMTKDMSIAGTRAAELERLVHGKPTSNHAHSGPDGGAIIIRKVSVQDLATQATKDEETGEQPGA